MNVPNFKCSKSSNIFNKFLAYYIENIYEILYNSFSELRYYWWRKVKIMKVLLCKPQCRPTLVQ